MTKPKKDVRFQRRAGRLSQSSVDSPTEERSPLRNGHGLKSGIESGMSTDAAWTDDDKEKVDQERELASMA